MWTSFLKGVVIGLLTGMPLGPIGAVCLRATLVSGRIYGLSAGLGSALADSVYATLALVGITMVSQFLIDNKLYIHFLGGLILIVYGIHMYLSKQPSKKEIKKDRLEANLDNKSLFRTFFTTFFLSFANPSTIFSFIAVFTGSRLSHISQGIRFKLILLSGTFCGSMLWWLLLVFAASKLKEGLNIKNMTVVNKSLATLIIISGIIIFFNTSYFKSMIIIPILQSRVFKIFIGIKENLPF